MATQSTTTGGVPLINFGTIGQPKPTPTPLTSQNMTIGQFGTPSNANSTTSLPNSLGAQAKAPTVTPQSHVLPANQVKPPTVTPSAPTTGGIDYTLKAGESLDAYKARTAQYYSQPSSPAPVTSQNTVIPSPQTQAPLQQQGQTFDQNNQGLYGQLIAALANKSTAPSSDYLAAQKQAQEYNAQLNQSRQQQAQALAGNASNPIPLEFQQGRAQIMNTQYGQQQAALGSAFQGASTLLGAANTQQGLQQQGLGAAAGLAAPIQAPYSNQVLNPLTGQPLGGGGGNGGSALQSLPAQAQQAIASYAEQVRNGSMTRGDAEARLGAYGVVGTNALNEMLGNNFNTNASNASAGTTAQGQQLQTASASAKAALNTLQQLFNALPGVQTGGIPWTNSIANWIQGQLGQGQLSAYNNALHDARAQLQGVLTASGAATPTGAQDMAQVLLPDNMTPQQLQQNMSTITQLMDQKVQSFTQSGQQTGSQNNGPGTTTAIMTSAGPVNPNF